MSNPIRTAGVVGAVGGALSALAGLAVEVVVKPGTEVADDRWSYPWSGGAFVAVCVVYAVFHALVFYGILGFARSGAAGPGRAARLGTATALTGTAVLLVAELLSIPMADRHVDDSGAALVGACFGLGTLLSAVGFLVAGVATVRAARWDGWPRYTPLAAGVWMTALVFLAMTPLLAIGVAVYGLLVTALGIAVATRPVREPALRAR